MNMRSDRLCPILKKFVGRWLKDMAHKVMDHIQVTLAEVESSGCCSPVKIELDTAQVSGHAKQIYNYYKCFVM